MILHPSFTQITRYLDGVLSETARKKVQRHIDHCKKCNKEIQFLRVTEQLLEAPKVKFIPITRNVMERIQERKWNVSKEFISEIKSVIGKAVIQSCTKGNDREVFPGCILRKGNTLKTVGESKALVEWKDGSQIYINEETELDFQTSSYPLTLRLGEIFSMMKPQEETFEIQTPSAVLSVIGTDFDTKVNKEKQTNLKVFKGKVGYKNKTGDVLVKKNQQVEASEYTQPNVTQIKGTQTIREWTTSINPHIKTGGSMKNIVIVILVLVIVGMAYYVMQNTATNGKPTQSIQTSTQLAGHTELMSEAAQGQMDKVKELLAKGADINAKDNNGWTALREAAKNGQTDIVKTLLDHGADSNVKDNNGWTALREAAKNGYADIVKTLLDHGAEVNAKDKNGRTALREAKNDDVVKLLKSAGASE